MDNWMQSIHSRIEELEEKAGDDDSHLRTSQGPETDLSPAVQKAIEDAVLRMEKTKKEEQEAWRSKVEEDLRAWKEEQMKELHREAAVNAANAVKPVIKEAEELLAKIESKTKEAPPEKEARTVSESEGTSSELNNEISSLKKKMVEVEQDNHRLEERIDDILSKVEEAEDRSPRRINRLLG